MVRRIKTEQDSKVTSTVSSANRFLLVDDHEPFRKMLTQFLPGEGEIAECEDGSFALKSYEDFQPDLVLMDVEMPVMDGISATRSLLERYPEAQIVILTQHDSPEMKRAALQAGAKAILPKDDLGALGDLIKNLLSS